MSIKAPRAKCGSCDKVLTKHGRRRAPSPQQQRLLDAAAGTERGRLLYRYSGGVDDRFQAEINEDGTADIYCSKCSIAYQPRDYVDRVYAAHERGEDLILLRGDIRRDT